MRFEVNLPGEALCTFQSFIDVVYNPDCEDNETPFMVSEEYIKILSR